MTTKTFEQTIDELRTVLMMRQELTYFAQILLQCRVHEDTNIPTACINGIDLRINPDWFLALEGDDAKAKFKHQLFVMFHEALHPALCDMDWGKGLNHKIANMAADYFNNAYIHEQINSITYPMNGGYLYDKRFSGMTKQEIYDILVKENPEDNNPLQGDLGNGSPQDDDNGQGSGGKSKEEMIQEVQQAVQQAAIAAEQSGYGKTIPGNVKEFLDKLYNPKLPWNELLQRYMSDMLNRDDYSYSRPNPHYLSQGFYIPSLHSESVGAIGMAHDESCSVSDEDVRLYLGAIHDVWETMKPSSLEIVGFTTQISKKFKFNHGDSLDGINFRGHGGTCIFPVMDHFKDKELEVLVVFTDMEFQYPDVEPPYPVIWICVGNKNARPPKFGTMIHVSH